MSDMKSTEPSIMKARLKKENSLESKELPKIEKIKGMKFESSIGHQYLREIDEKDLSP
jgi:hypothetical protein